MRLHYLVGLGSVCGLEKRSLRRLGRVFEYLNTIVAIIILLQWHFEMTALFTSITILIIDWLIWLFFFGQYIGFLIVVRDKVRYIQQNWFLPFIIIAGIPLILAIKHTFPFYHGMRPLLALVLLTPWFGLVKRSLTDDRLSTTLITVFFTVILAGYLISGIDPGLGSPAQGIWWAWVTMSTVGYGDYVPLTLAGRLFASLLILIGLCFFAILTANFSSYFVRRHVRRFRSSEARDIRRVIRRIETVETRDEKILQLLEDINQRLVEFEKRQGEK